MARLIHTLGLHKSHVSLYQLKESRNMSRVKYATRRAEIKTTERVVTLISHMLEMQVLRHSRFLER